MTHEIPEPYVWDETFRVFYENLDEQHKGLFRGIFAVAGNKTDAAALSNLVTVVKQHFSAEEDMMKKAKYGHNDGEYDAHHKLHTEFVKTISALSTPVSEANVHYAKQWLVDHIKGTDFKYKGHL